MQILSDKTAIGLSLLCAVHCLVFPLIIVLLPGFAALPLDDESFHLWMLLAVIPTSIYALTLGCRKHKNYQLAFFGIAGLILLISAYVLGEDTIGELGEKGMTLLGVSIVALGHLWNYRLCLQSQTCECTGDGVHENA